MRGMKDSAPQCMAKVKGEPTIIEIKQRTFVPSPPLVLFESVLLRERDCAGRLLGRPEVRWVEGGLLRKDLVKTCCSTLG